MRMSEILEPSACSWCGIPKRRHAVQGAGSKRHTWLPPTTQQTIGRMVARRETPEGRGWRWQ